MDRTEIVVVDVKMPFWSMVRFMLKWAIAAIPAALLLAVLAFILTGVLMALTENLGRNLRAPAPVESR